MGFIYISPIIHYSFAHDDKVSFYKRFGKNVRRFSNQSWTQNLDQKYTSTNTKLNLK